MTTRQRDDEDGPWRIETRRLIGELDARLTETQAQLSSVLDNRAVLAGRIQSVETEIDKLEPVVQGQADFLAALDERLTRLEQRVDQYHPEEPGEPQWSLVADVPCTAVKSDGWSEPYEGGGKGGSASQGPRVAEHLEVDAVDDVSVMRFWTKPYEGRDRTLWNGYELKHGDWASSGIMLTGYLVGPGMAWETEARAFGPTKWTRMAALTWPQKGDPWPKYGEIDYLEAGGDPEYRDRQEYKISNWYEDGGVYGHDEHEVPCDLTQWHTWRVEWYAEEPEADPAALVFYVDGAEVWRTTEHVPPGPHRLAFQTALEGGPLAKDGTEVGGFEVRAVRIYQRGG